MKITIDITDKNIDENDNLQTPRMEADGWKMKIKEDRLSK
jgi:hypothetical protein